MSEVIDKRKRERAIRKTNQKGRLKVVKPRKIAINKRKIRSLNEIKQKAEELRKLMDTDLPLERLKEVYFKIFNKQYEGEKDDFIMNMIQQLRKILANYMRMTLEWSIFESDYMGWDDDKNKEVKVDIVEGATFIK